MDIGKKIYLHIKIKLQTLNNYKIFIKIFYSHN